MAKTLRLRSLQKSKIEKLKFDFNLFFVIFMFYANLEKRAGSLWSVHKNYLKNRQALREEIRDVAKQA